MTVNELIAALQKLADEGHGTKPVFADEACGAPGVCHSMEQVASLHVIEEEPHWIDLPGGGQQLVGERVSRVEIGTDS